MTLEGLYEELADLNESEVRTIHKLVQALKRTRVSPLAYIEEMMNFQSVGFDEEKGVYVHRMLITDELKNRYKILHGGITATFIDTAMGSTVFQAVGENSRAVTLELSVNFLSPGMDGWLKAETRVVKKGKTIIVLETKVTDEREKLIATASSTFFRL
ncbi:PaaI family thioesterase [Paenactinomyces guangxiensis]|uniref:PaaI family thioesterase n=1 Tax=Paenactinomyces guangxiensis TaxID=1490290 RepID=A0A7W1WMZ6_9BACL|nr:PaaI family thioesterase [Paenactinomyces guangxiensis]MBA4492861.1 PaaI family thioesterase [Paenactinomyces guangxiensis]MBH8590290.1 PaaI family thioesterase [Paenactinomyces guangxiensis]